jgi:hypothetical protein
VLVADDAGGRLVQLSTDGTVINNVEITPDGSGRPVAMCLCDEGMFVTEVNGKRVLYFPSVV